MEEKIYTCPLELTQKILSKKWTVIILWLLRHGKVRTKDFKNQIKGSNEKMIIEHLKYLIEEKLIEKREYDVYPKKTEYILSEKGKIYYLFWNLCKVMGKNIMLNKNLIIYKKDDK